MKLLAAYFCLSFFLLVQAHNVKGVENTFEKSINVVRLFSWLVMTTPAQTHNTPLGAL